MKKGFLLLSSVLILALLLSACGGKGEEDVVGDLSDLLNNMESYKAEAELALQTGEEPQEYLVEVWHQEPHYYRIGLTNKAREMTQIILRNDDGVFVLTPHLNKSFRFQSGWPENQGQVYLFESLVKDIVSDSNRKFSTEGGDYVFEVAANYQNRTLAHQRITLSKDLKPVKVEVMDADFNELVVVDFTNVEFDYAFENDAFDMERNMQGALLDSLPAMAEGQEAAQGSFGTYYPTYEPGQVDLVEEQEVTTEDGDPRVVLRYAGDYHFNVIQERPQAKKVHMPNGDPVDLGFGIGVMTDNSLQWTYEGVDFTLSSSDMPQEEMVRVAQSFVGQSSK
ncbi:LolA family protein [Caldalkalibacillus salinus]|uniref:LolA family protein n=1 Tax=Caldalkalibacillus salinus TaxID=2803787 RepID=UPI0019215383|nr:outer membrane lipoprotein carrier protein LolA [Caldalkalibacillus salinus]